MPDLAVRIGRSSISVFAAALLLAGCSLRANVEPLPPEAKNRADRFVQALVVNDDLATAARYSYEGVVDPSVDWNTVKEAGFNEVVGPGRVRRDCGKRSPYKPDGQTEFEDCIVYDMKRPGHRGRTTHGTLIVWMEREDGVWNVSSFQASWD